MANSTIPMLPMATGVTGDEMLEAVQGGQSVRVTSEMIANLGGPTGPTGPPGGPTGPTGPAGASVTGPTGPTGTVANVPWTAYTPSVRFTSGVLTAYTANGWSTQIGSVVNFTLKVTLTNIGTASGTMLTSTHVVAAVSQFVASGYESVTGKALLGFGYPGSEILSVTFYDGSTSFANGNVLTLSGTYQVT